MSGTNISPSDSCAFGTLAGAASERGQHCGLSVAGHSRQCALMTLPDECQVFWCTFRVGLAVIDYLLLWCSWDACAAAASAGV